jgi:class 3 adenylate cyclase
VTESVGPRRARALLNHVIGLADEPADGDDLRLRKRVLVTASYILIVGALQLPALAQGLPLSSDAYMAVAGAPEPRPDHASAAMALARGMLTALDEARNGLDAPLELRIGLASGPVMGGVIGQRRILFDLWGDTVNTASRMESSRVAGRIQVAPSTRDLLLGSHAFEEREPVEVKGLGRMTTYLLADPATSG